VKTIRSPRSKRAAKDRNGTPTNNVELGLREAGQHFGKGEQDTVEGLALDLSAGPGPPSHPEAVVRTPTEHQQHLGINDSTKKHPEFFSEILGRRAER